MRQLEKKNIFFNYPEKYMFVLLKLCLITLVFEKVSLLRITFKHICRYEIPRVLKRKDNGRQIDVQCTSPIMIHKITHSEGSNMSVINSPMSPSSLEASTRMVLYYFKCLPDLKDRTQLIDISLVHGDSIDSVFKFHKLQHVTQYGPS